MTYEPAPVDLSEILVDLEAVSWRQPESGERVEAEGAGPEQLASFAITHNPLLQAVRSRIGVSLALLVEAGLLSDPTIGWDGMDALASQIVEGGATTIDYVSGLGLSMELPRPGELDAKKGAARWRVEEARRQVTQAEWTLARDVFVACEDLLEAERLLQQNRDLVQVAQTTREYFERAKEAGAATAIQANLALGDLFSIRAERIRLQARLRDARHRLNALLGLSPATVIPIVAAASPPPESAEETRLAPELLVEQALSLRPDLAVLLASYQAAEDDVRLEIAKQFPQFTIGTGIWIVPGFFTKFNRPAIETALARREALRKEVEAAVHEVRREIHDALASLGESRRELRFLESKLLPNAEENLQLTGEAFNAGAVTLLEILTLQRALVDAVTRTTEVRAEFQRRHWRLLAASGTLLATPDAPALENEDHRTPARR